MFALAARHARQCARQPRRIGQEFHLQDAVRVSVQHLYPDHDSKRRLDRQHARLCNAVTQGQADLARRAAKEHIDGIRRQLQELEAKQLRLEHARQRLNGL